MRRVLISGIFVVFCFLTVVILAQVPQLLNYQGRLTDDKGIPIITTTTVRFSLYQGGDAATPGSGTLCYQEDVSVTPDDNGVFSHLIGSGSVIFGALDATVFQTAEPVYLEITIDPAGANETLLPRKKIVTVGYSFKSELADDADTLDGQDASAFAPVVHNHDPEYVNEGEADSVTSAMIVDGTIVDADINAGANIAASKINRTNLNADLLDGKDSVDFVHTTGDDMFGSLTIVTSSSPALWSVTSKPGGYGVYGWADDTSSTNYGVYGRSDSTSGYGVYGTAPLYGVYGFASTTSGYGVYGTAPLYGVYGFASTTSGANYGVYGKSNSTSGYGVYGYSSKTSGTNYGVYGRSDSSDGRGVYGLAESNSGTNYGVYGKSESPYGYGVYGTALTYGLYATASATSGTNYGVYGKSNSSDIGYGVYGSAPTYGVYGEATATSGYAYGVYGKSNSSLGAGVHGESLKYGVYGYASATSGENYGVYGYSSSSSGYGVCGEGGAYAGFFVGNVHVTGLITVGGVKPCVQPIDNGKKVLLYAMESPEIWFEDFGTAQLVNGQAVVQLESVFTQAANTEAGYMVFLTPIGEWMGLYISRQDKDAFEVREQGDGTSNISFYYRIVAKRRGYEEVRFEEFTEPEQPPAEPNLPVEKK